jgi:hypothetical protein
LLNLDAGLQDCMWYSPCDSPFPTKFTFMRNYFKHILKVPQ